MKLWPRPKPWLELIIYLVVFAVLGAGLYLLKRTLKGPERPTYFPIEDAPRKNSP
jgi:hypothetical protein